MNENQYKNSKEEVRNIELMVCWWLTNEDDSLTRLDKIDLLFTPNLFCCDTSNSPSLNTLTIPSRFIRFHAGQTKKKHVLALLMITQ